jgi:hypothetical protein
LCGRGIGALCIVGALVLPAFVARAVSGIAADALGDRLAYGLVNALGPVSAALAPPDTSLSFVDLAPETRGLRAVSTPQKGAHAAKRGSKANASHAIRISSAQVLSLAARRAMPDAAPVRASAEHPAGLQLRGVSALGIGLQDGDVLTEAAGQRASSVAAVVGVVLAARSRHSPEISGRFFRAGVPYVVVVEQPYPQ